LIAGGKAEDFPTAIKLAVHSINSGAAMQVLENLVAFSRKFR